VASFSINGMSVPASRLSRAARTVNSRHPSLIRGPALVDRRAGEGLPYATCRIRLPPSITTAAGMALGRVHR